MAFLSIPSVTFGNNPQGKAYGGLIYGLNLESNYEEGPSRLVLNIVNEKGVYNINDSNLFNLVSVNFGSFKFNGYVSSYSEKTTSEDKILEVEIIDKSIELDRWWVLLWKRGLLNQKGTVIPVKKTFDFSSERELIPVMKNINGWPFVSFELKTLPKIEITRNSYGLTNPIKIGNVILIGKEKFRNSRCEIADTEYNFTDLLKALPIDVVNSKDKNPNYKKTYEGTLRSVLSNWCADFGMSFYWDYSNDTLVFYDISAGISNINTSLESENIISKDIKSSIEGTFRQYSIGLTQKPRSRPQELTSDFNISYTRSNNPYPLSYFMSKKGYAKAISDEGSTRWGANRSLNEFITAAHCGFVSNGLRDIYAFSKSHWEVLGYDPKVILNANKIKILGLFKQLKYDVFNDYESLDAVDLPNFNFQFINYDATIHQKWRDIEQEMLEYLGRFYRIPDNTGNFFYCFNDKVIEIEASTEPSSSKQEDKSADFSGQYIFERSGSMSHSAEEAANALRYEELIKELQICAPLHVDLKESGLIDYITPEILSKNDAKKVNTLLIYPNNTKFVQNLIGFSASSFVSSSHPLETDRIDILNKNSDKNKISCKTYDKNLEEKGCLEAQEEARNKSLKAAGLKGDDPESSPPENFVDGLVNKRNWATTINLIKGRVTINSKSDAPYGSVTRYNFRAKKIFQENSQELVYSEGNVGIAGKVAEIRVLVDDLTNSEYDDWGVKRKSLIPKASELTNTTPQKSVTYVFAGIPQGLTLSPRNGLSKLDISYSSEGFQSTTVFSTRPPNPPTPEVILRTVQSQLNRTSFNGG